MLSFADIEAATAASVLASMASSEWKPTYFQLNAGTLIPFILNGRGFVERVHIRGGAVISSLALEGSELHNVTFEGLTFVRASFLRVQWHAVSFERCDLGELTVDEDSSYDNVNILDCRIDSIRVTRQGEEVAREYAPSRVRFALEELGFRFGDTYVRPELGATDDTEVVRIARRFLRMFHRTTIVSDHQVDARFRQDRNVVYETVIPSMVRHGLLDERPWRGAGVQRVWGLRCLLDTLLAAEGSNADSESAAFWSEVHAA